MRDLTSALQTRDCTTVGCPDEADGPDGLCRRCRTTPARPTPTASELRALFNDDQEPRMAGYNGTVCKIDGCNGDPISRHGMNAGLCAIHRDQAAWARRQARLGSSAAAAASPTPPSPAAPVMTTPEEREAPPVSLTSLAAHVDTTRYELDQARQRHEAAIADLREALDREAA